MEFNIPFSGLQRIFLHLMLFGKPVQDIPRIIIVLTVLRKSPFCTLILTVSGPDMHHITTWNGPYRSAIKALSQDEENTIGISSPVNHYLSTTYKDSSFLRFSAQNPVAYDFTRILRKFHDKNLTFPTALFVFLYFCGWPDEEYPSATSLSATGRTSWTEMRAVSSPTDNLN